MYLGFERLHDTLPIFRRITGESVLYYAPGYVARVPHAGQAAFESVVASGSADQTGHPAAALVLKARSAVTRWSEMVEQPYRPTCLTIYPTDRCNLRCAYCYAAPHGARRDGRRGVAIETVRDAAHIVAENCRERGLPFTLVIHGGGEPTFDLPALEAILTVVQATTRMYRLPLYRYIATNGVMPLARARWLAQSFDLAGLSCDGPGEIQAMQRPLPGGRSSTPIVERTADTLRQAGMPFNVRVTLTPHTIPRQVEIVDYICARIRPREIHIEPVYQGGRANAASTAGTNLAETFCAQFVAARQRGAREGVRVLFTGARPGEIHGPYCQVFRGVLNLVPGDAATACFKLGSLDQAARLDAVVGRNGLEGFEIDSEGVRAVRERLAPAPRACQDCFNQYHCARACPDACPLEPGDARPWDSFRCQAQMLLAAAAIEEAAALQQHESELQNAAELPRGDPGLIAVRPVMDGAV